MFWVGGMVAPVADVWSVQKLSFVQPPMFSMMIVVLPTTHRKSAVWRWGSWVTGPSSVWNLLHVPPLAPRFWRWLPDSWTNRGPLFEGFNIFKYQDLGLSSGIFKRVRKIAKSDYLASSRPFAGNHSAPTGRIVMTFFFLKNLPRNFKFS